MIKEACVESIEQCMKAEQKGANRIELCASLNQDGLTPSEKLIHEVSEKLGIPIRIMIRNRAGDFIYTKEEREEMKKSIDLCKKYPVEGVVFGICRATNELDIAAIKELADYSQPLKVTIHKAIDICNDPLQELKKLKSLKNIDSVLTSGKSNTAQEGIALLKAMVIEAGKEIELIVCGKVTSKNLDSIKKQTGAYAFHGKLIVGNLN